MPSLAEIAASHPSFQTFHGSLRKQTPNYVKGSLSIFSLGNEKGLPSSWKTLNRSKRVNFNDGQIKNHVKGSLSISSLGNEKGLPSSWKTLNRSKRVNFNAGQIKNHKRYFLIQAVATLEPKGLIRREKSLLSYKDSENKLPNNEDGLDVELSSSNGQTESSNEQIDEMDEREKLRRMRISEANKGNTPWNKGRKHSPETLRLIKERTKLAMQNPKVKMKLTKIGHSQSDETRIKIGVGVRMGWQKRREKLTVQEFCLYEWQNLVAEASRQGYNGEEELQWDSYNLINEELKEEWVESVEQRKRLRRRTGNSRAPKSPEQRQKISEAIKAKWANSEYRERVCSALHKYHGTPDAAKRRPRKKPSESAQSTTKSPRMKKIVSDTESSSVKGVELQSQRLKAMRSKAPQFKDPLVGSKLEMIKNIRAQRTIADTQKTEAIGRARLLIAEAEKAAEALAVAATKSPIARASLMETRKLIAEAKQSIESIDMGPMRTSSEINNSSSAASNEVISLIDREPSVKPVYQDEADHREVNGIQSLELGIGRDFELSKFNLSDILSYDEGFIRDSNGFALSHFNRMDQTKQPDWIKESEKKPPVNGAEVSHFGEETNSKTVSRTKKWVRGRLVEESDSE